MTEEEWQACHDPKRMLDFLIRHGMANKRRLRLFAVAGARDLLAYNPDPGRRGDHGDIKGFEAAILHAEACADGEESLEPYKFGSMWVELRDAADAAYVVLGMDPDVGTFLRNPAEVVPEAIQDFQVNPVHWLRDIFGNPLRPVAIAPACLTSTVLSLAHAAYSEPIAPSGQLDPDRLAVLADALEDAGCTDAAILEHLRGPGPHVRGCWCVDALLGRS